MDDFPAEINCVIQEVEGKQDPLSSVAIDTQKSFWSHPAAAGHLFCYLFANSYITSTLMQVVQVVS